MRRVGFAGRKQCDMRIRALRTVVPEEITMKNAALITLSLAMLATPALAQNAPGMSSQPRVTVGAAPPDVKYSTLGKDEMFSSKLKGLNVYNARNETVGEITDIAIGAGHQVDALILSVGGFLGVGERYIAVVPSSIAVRYDNDKSQWRATMNTSKEELQKAPEFKYPK
jgi:hypothetical protein